MSSETHIVCPHCDAINRVAPERIGEKPNCGQCKEPLFTAQPLELSDSRFDLHVRRSGIPLIVDFWAPWCAPCRQMAPIYAEAAKILEPRVRLAKINTDAYPELAALHVIRSIPTLAFFRDGAEVERLAGVVELFSLVRWAKSHL